MTSEQIHEKLDNLYNSPASKKFINHLIMSYFPIKKVTKVLSKPAVAKFRCALTNVELCSLNDVIAILNDEEVKNKFIEMAFGELEMNPPEGMDEIIKPLLKEKRIALTGFQTDTFLSWRAYQELYEWVAKKVLAGDKNINWLIKQTMEDDQTKTAGAADNTNKEERPKLVLKQKPKVSTLGDIDCLRELKYKLEAEEKLKK